LEERARHYDQHKERKLGRQGGAQGTRRARREGQRPAACFAAEESFATTRTVTPTPR
jgi:hypothetical protein